VSFPRKRESPTQPGTPKNEMPATAAAHRFASMTRNFCRFTDTLTGYAPTGRFIILLHVITDISPRWGDRDQEQERVVLSSFWRRWRFCVFCKM